MALDQGMLRVYSDFNARTPNGECWILVYRDMDLDKQIEGLGLTKGSKVILYQDDDDFEVTATLDFRYSDFLKRDAWVAIPDWDTLVRK